LVNQAFGSGPASGEGDVARKARQDSRLTTVKD
jgi:hypothetical protein